MFGNFFICRTHHLACFLSPSSRGIIQQCGLCSLLSPCFLPPKPTFLRESYPTIYSGMNVLMQSFILPILLVVLVLVRQLANDRSPNSTRQRLFLACTSLSRGRGINMSISISSFCGGGAVGWFRSEEAGLGVGGTVVGVGGLHC